MCWHKFGQWEKIGTVTYYRDEEGRIPIMTKIVQERKCKKCGYVHVDNSQRQV